MTVKQLIEMLKDCNQNHLVILSSDGEGNTFDTLHYITKNAIYEDREISIIDDKDDSGNAIVFWP